MRFTRSLKILAGATLAAGALAGVSQAALSNDGVIITCVNPTSGSWRVVEPATNGGRPCPNTETPLTLNQKGQPGPAGPAGPAGPQGPAGAPGVSQVFAKWVSGEWSPTDVFSTATKVSVTSGNYRVTAKGTATMNEMVLMQGWATITCQLRTKHATGFQTDEILDSTIVEVSDDGPQYGTFMLQGVMNVPVGYVQSVRLDCMSDTSVAGEGYDRLRNLNLHVEQIGAFTQTQG